MVDKVGDGLDWARSLWSLIKYDGWKAALIVAMFVFITHLQACASVPEKVKELQDAGVERVIQVEFKDGLEKSVLSINDGVCHIESPSIPSEERVWHTGDFPNMGELGYAFLDCVGDDVGDVPIQLGPGQVRVYFSYTDSRTLSADIDTGVVGVTLYHPRIKNTSIIVIAHDARWLHRVAGHELLHALPSELPWCGGSFHRDTLDDEPSDGVDECIQEGLHNVNG